MPSSATISAHGSTPALNSASIVTGGVVWNCCATTPYRISGIEGTRIRPRLPDAVSRPSENFSPYFCCSNAGYSTAPSATIVTPVAPVKAVNIAQAITATIARPPGNQPSKAFVTRTMRCGAWLSAST